MRRPARVLTCLMALAFAIGAAACSDPLTATPVRSSTTVAVPATPPTTPSSSPSPTTTSTPSPPARGATGSPRRAATRRPASICQLATCGVVLNAESRRVRVLSVAYSGLEGSGLPQDEAVSATGCDGWVAPSQADADSMADAGFNSVRLAFSWANLEPKPTPPAADGSLRHVYDQRYLAALDDAVHAFTSRGMAVTRPPPGPVVARVQGSAGVRPPPGLLPGSRPPRLAVPERGRAGAMVAAERSFSSAATRTPCRGWRMPGGSWPAGTPRLHVGADLLNEPYDLLTAPYPNVSDLSPADLDLAGFYERLGAAVHEVAPTWLRFVEENISRRTGRFALIRKPELANMVLAPHFYQATWDQVGIDRLERYLEKSRTWDVPLWLGETTRFALDPGWASASRTTSTGTPTGTRGGRCGPTSPGWFDGSVQPGMVDVVQGGF